MSYDYAYRFQELNFTQKANLLDGKPVLTACGVLRYRGLTTGERDWLRQYVGEQRARDLIQPT